MLLVPQANRNLAIYRLKPIDLRNYPLSWISRSEKLEH